MCITPQKIINEEMEEITVACRECWQCHRDRVNDYVGRCIAEQETARATYSVTLTYGGDHPNCATLVYADVQGFMKRVRAKYGKVRYIVAGEYGEQKGRAHWHIVLFFHEKVPEISDPETRDEWQICLPRYKRDSAGRFHWRPWRAGLVYFQEPDYRGFEYVLKYILKDYKAANARSHFGLTKQPPLGWPFFDALAQEYVDKSLSPQSYAYSFRDIFDRKGRRRKFWIQGRTRELFVEAYLSYWQEAKGQEHPLSELLEKHDELMMRRSFGSYLSEDYWRKCVPAKRPWRGRLEDMTDGPVFTFGEIDGIPAKMNEAPDGALWIWFCKNDEVEVWREEREEMIEHVKGRFRPVWSGARRDRIDAEFRRLRDQEVAALCAASQSPERN